ncbi:DUF269 domain-containing protein [Chrysiogenes arsenatis]|uniref:DUF269 domain-containing protein n=1 Tax=Chrysiogenes arsenatis TaxID=309797 RepID=UPI00041A8F39|nr:DUF269 domain-containing protein [Chrysiogenes arsenatis]
MSNNDPQAIFWQALVAKVRAHDSYNTWKKFDDATLLRPLLRSREEKKKVDLHAPPGEQLLWFLRRYYETVAYLAEKTIGEPVMVCMDISHEGFGTVLLYAGNRVLLNKSVRNVQKFGFADQESLCLEGLQLLHKATTPEGS